LRFETNTSADLNKRNFGKAEDIEKLERIIEGDNWTVAGHGKL
jgi:hypothetical protein